MLLFNLLTMLLQHIQFIVDGLSANCFLVKLPSKLKKGKGERTGGGAEIMERLEG